MSPTNHRNDSPMPPMQLDDDEKRVLAECERDSLVYRSIPLGLISFFATQFAMSRNLITPRGKWFKFSASLFAGYIIGKVSYAPTCRNKILTQIPNSNLAYAIRGAETRDGSTASDAQDYQPQVSIKPKDPNEPVVFLPDPVEIYTHTVPVGVNQYGDPIFDASK